MQVLATPAIHQQRKILLIQFDDNAELMKRFKQLPGAKWSKTLKSWYLPDTGHYRVRFGLLPASRARSQVLGQVNKVNGPEFKNRKELLILKNLKPQHT